MPDAAPRVCLVASCPLPAKPGAIYCATHHGSQVTMRPNEDTRRRYRTARWARLRLAKKFEDPFCADCMREGLLIPWTDLDHIIPARMLLTDEDWWNPRNLAGLCHRHHLLKTRRGE